MEDEMGRESSTNGGNVYRLLVGKPERNIPLRRQRRKPAEIIKIDFREIG
jgi:hypothetical protein